MSLDVWRIGLAAATTLFDQSYGSTLAPGRWHSLRPGSSNIGNGNNVRRLVYAAGSRALAQLEKRVHANGVEPVGQALFRLSLPAKLRVADAGSLGLPADWRNDEGATRAFGDRWLDQAKDLALWVPSVVEPGENHLLLNAVHPRFGEVLIEKERDPFDFDPRLG